MLCSLVRRSFDHYSVLGLHRSATQAQIRSAYLGLVRKHHPDSNCLAGSAKKFLKVQAAWEILRDPIARAELDHGGPGGTARSAGQPWAYQRAARNAPEPWPSRREHQACRETRARRNLADLVEGRLEGEAALRLNFERAAYVDDKVFESLAKDLPAGLESLALKFEGCGRISDEGLTLLAEGLAASRQLRSLTLDFTDCLRITNAGFSALAKKLPRHLRHLSLDVSYCRQIGDESIVVLAKHLPEGLVELRLGLLETSVSPAVAALADELPALRRWGTPARRSRARSAPVRLSTDPSSPCSSSRVRPP